LCPSGGAAGTDGRSSFRALAGARWWPPGNLLDERVEVLRAVCGRRDRGRWDVGRGDRALVREDAACEAAGEGRPLVAERNPCLADPLNHLYVGLGDECLDAHDELAHGAEAVTNIRKRESGTDRTTLALARVRSCAGGGWPSAGGG